MRQLDHAVNCLKALLFACPETPAVLAHHIVVEELGHCLTRTLSVRIAHGVGMQANSVLAKHSEGQVRRPEETAELVWDGHALHRPETRLVVEATGKGVEGGRRLEEQIVAVEERAALLERLPVGKEQVRNERPVGWHVGCFAGAVDAEVSVLLHVVLVTVQVRVEGIQAINSRALLEIVRGDADGLVRRQGKSIDEVLEFAGQIGPAEERSIGALCSHVRLFLLLELRVKSTQSA
ncbi:hypothetical protein MPH_00227 [Macrophomina phaseolina MS6]|uniref:Uncharacterized protein n=1 Tax=Macrophomina phaseolina (strain MS6) TaxID=1126212 RepID=K2SC39_MACPH|nr:hypothetical protein MPH_00227 [Macrophomina phaseolina MS6]